MRNFRLRLHVLDDSDGKYEPWESALIIATLEIIRNYVPPDQLHLCDMYREILDASVDSDEPIYFG